jgi:hypothetical protein
MLFLSACGVILRVPLNLVRFPVDKRLTMHLFVSSLVVMLEICVAPTGLDLYFFLSSLPASHALAFKLG